MPDPTCARDEVVVQVSRCGICGTDVHIYRNEYMSDFPLIPGHEFGGVIVEVGSDVTDVHVGDRVAVDPNLYCGHCDFCRNEQANHCLNWQGVGVTRSGGFAEYVTVPARACYHVPAGMSDLQAAFIEPLACVVHAMKRFRILPGESLLILAAGPWECCCSRRCATTVPPRLWSSKSSPPACSSPATWAPRSWSRSALTRTRSCREMAPRGFGVVIDATGVPAVIEQAFPFLRPRGKYLQFGVAPNHATVQWSPYDIFHKDWTILGSFALCYTFQPAIALLSSGVVKVESLVSDTAPLGELQRRLPPLRRRPDDEGARNRQVTSNTHPRTWAN